MEVGVVKIAEDSDFDMLKTLIDDNTNWTLEYDKGDGTKVWTKPMDYSELKIVKVHSVFKNINPDVVFDVLLDPDFRKEWDANMIESIDIGYLNPNNDIGYYSISCPSPLKNRDFVLQRSWLDLGNEKLIFNHSVCHADYPARKGFVRALSYLTGFVLRRRSKDTFLGYVTQTDPCGKLAPWLVNKVTQKYAPKIIKQLHKASQNYPQWKNEQKNPNYKPWMNPEQMLRLPKINSCICPSSRLGTSREDDKD